MGLKRCQNRKRIPSNKGSNSEKVEQSNAKKRRHTDGAFEILALPLFLIYEILSRLPIDTILRCKYLCKTFRQIISDPCFTEKPRSIEHRMIVVDKFAPFNFFSFRILDLEKPLPSSSCSFTRNEDYNDPENSYYWQTLSMPNSIAKEGIPGTHLFGSSNGLVCVCYATTRGYIYYICNPILGEYMAISPPTSKSSHRVGFGFCKKTKQYKFIQFQPDLYCNVLTLGQDNWKRIDNVPYPHLTLISIGPSFNGYLHWNTGSYVLEKWICSLNLETEEVKYVPPPTHINQDKREIMTEIQLALFDGSFCVSYVIGRRKFELCAMKDYGVKESWTKMVAIDLDSNRNLVMPMTRLLNNGIVLLGRYKDSLIYYNTRNGRKKLIMAKGQQYDALDYFPSLISLKNIAGAENVEIARCKRHRNIFHDSESHPFI